MTAVLGCIKHMDNWEYIQINSEWELKDFLDIIEIEKPTYWLITDSNNTKILTVNMAKHILRKGVKNAE